YLLEEGTAYDEYKIQCQGQLWVSGRKWVDLLAWHPELPPALHRIERDESFIPLLSSAVDAFSKVLESQWLLCQTRGWMPKNGGIGISPEKPLTEIVRDELIQLK